jgi:hypothetical protein
MKLGKRVLPVAWAVVLLVAGCGKHTPPPASTSDAVVPNDALTNADTPVAADEAPALPATTTAAPASTAPPNLSEMTLDLHSWIGAKQRLPKNWEEYVASATKPIPAPPAGKKYAISSTWTVILVNR